MPKFLVLVISNDQSREIKNAAVIDAKSHDAAKNKIAKVLNLEDKNALFVIDLERAPLPFYYNSPNG